MLKTSFMRVLARRDNRGLRQRSKEEVLAPDTKTQVDSLLRGVARAPRSLLMLDYDGTLAPFCKNRESAFPYPGISAILQEIVRTGRTRVVIVSGREASDVIPLLDISPLPEIWGLHGLQRLNPDGSTELPPLHPQTVSELAAAENWLRYQHLEHTAELKTGSIAVHWRGLDECEAESVRGRVLMGWTPLAKYTRLDLLEFDGGVEIRAHKADKGAAVNTILNEMNSGVPAAYFGDDTSDEKAFQALNSRGLSVLVRPRWRRTAAQLWLKPPDELLDFLKRWLQACQEHDALNNDTTMAVNA
jgi:trehalose 6-phosphate phosphatase